MEKPIWTQSISDLQGKSGLTSEAAQKRLKKEGRNKLPEKGRIVWWKLLLSQFSSWIIWLLIGAAIVAGLLGEVIDFWAILAIVLLNALLGFVQEFRAETSLKALQDLAPLRSKVVRDGRVQEIFSEEIVLGDLVLIEAGDHVPADGRLVDLAHLSVEEAALTGESLPVTKSLDPVDEKAPLGDRLNMVHMGTTVARGKGHFLVTATALNTEMGKIASELMEEKKEETPLQRQLDVLGKRLVWLCLAIVLIVFGLGLFREAGLVEMLLIALSLAVAAIPEGLPAVVTISLSIGVRKMAEKKALIRRLSSVETLGSASVICTDKTGTLTQNEMTVRKIYVDQGLIEVTGSGYAPEGEFSGESPSLDLALKIGALCNNASLAEEGNTWKIIGDPTEGALLTAAAKKGINPKDEILDEMPFDSERKRMSVLTKEGLFVKGAPDVLLPLSTKQLVGNEEIPINREEIMRAGDALAAEAFRVLAVGCQKIDHIPETEELVFVGLIAMRDPPRPEVKQAIKTCTDAGIQTVMVTGDHKKTAEAIARELDMDTSRVVDGSEIGTLVNQEIENVTVFSRISASDKLRILETYKQRGEVTAMTGDGVNDAPAVQAADIGIAMGITGTDVTKGSSDMIILDDNFASIAKAVEEGRGIYDNIVKFVSYLLSSNIAEILVIFIAILFGFTADGTAFIPLLPVQLLWMNLVTDGFPAISLAMDPTDPLAMKRPPRPRSEEILNKRFTLFIFSISILVTAGALTACFIGLKTSAVLAQTMTFTTLIVLELVRVQMIRKQYRMKLFSNPYLLVALASSFLLQLAVLYIPSLNKVFGTVPLNVTEWGIIFGIGFALWWLGQGVTRLFYKK